MEIKVTGTRGSSFQAIRLTLDEGGPGAVEAIVDVDAEGATLKVWNPFRHEWATTVLTGHGDTRKVRRWLPVCGGCAAARAGD